MRELKILEKVYEQYKREVRDNENATREQVEKKLYRNMKLGVLSARPKGSGTYCKYGNLHFIVSDDDVVVWMKNKCAAPVGWKRDNKRYLELNKELGIDDDITMLGLIARDVRIRAKKKYGKLKWELKKRCSATVTQ